MTPNRIAMTVSLTAVAAGAIGFARIVERIEPKYVMVDELVDDPVFDRDLHVHGFVVPGTIRSVAGRLSFELQRQGRRVAVVGVPPCDTIRDQSEVVVEGQLAPWGVIDATGVEARCPTKYDGAPRPHPACKFE